MDDTHFGPFQILKKIAEGGMAATYLARVDGQSPGHELVVKRILKRLVEDDEFRDLFLEEARVATTLLHPQIVETFDVGYADGEHFLAMEYVWGEDLRHVAERGVRQSNFIQLRHVAYIIAKAAAGLHYFHTKTDDDGVPLGLVHRDVSPPNLMVTYDGRVKVVDFGIAKAESQYMNVRAGQLKGKFSYMSPEQVQGLEVDHRSDIFALGTILYELTTKRRLFKADSDILTIKMISDAAVSAPHESVFGYPEVLSRIVLRALAQYPEDRYDTALMLHDDLMDFLAQDDAELASEVGAYMRGAFTDRIAELEELCGEEYAGPSRPTLPPLGSPPILLQRRIEEPAPIPLQRGPEVRPTVQTSDFEVVGDFSPHRPMLWVAVIAAIILMTLLFMVL